MAIEPGSRGEDMGKSDGENGSSKPSARTPKKKSSKGKLQEKLTGDESRNIDHWSDFGLRRLFNPESTEFLPMEEQLKLYKQRDLSATKAYVIAARVFGHPRQRRRIYVAPKMGEEAGRSVNIRQANAALNRQSQKDGRPRLEPIGGADNTVLTERDKRLLHDSEVQDRMGEYKSWLHDRMALRAGLESMGLKESWLRNKPNPTPLERRVLAQLEEARRVAETLKAKIPISNVLLNELLNSLDQDSNAEIDYSEFVRGMDRYHIEERKRKILEEKLKADAKTKSALEMRVASPRAAHLAPVQESASTPTVSLTERDDEREVKTPDSLASLLEIPKRDITERRTLSPDELIEKRKRERYQSANQKNKKKLPRVIQSPLKTGNKAVDLHSQTSTLGGDLGVEIHDYRAARLAEYHSIIRLCEERGIPLTTKLLERALLHPGDKRVSQLRRRIRQPGTHTISNKFAEPPKPPESPMEYDDMEKVVVTKSGEVLVDAKHVYPKKQDLWPKPELQSLPTGKAFVNRKVDCWMSFEEYDRLTKHLKKRYVSLENESEHDVFWPGYMLDKIQLHMPETRSRDAVSSHSVFQPTRARSKRSNPGYNNDISYWLMSDQGYLKSGDIEARKVYSIDWK